MADTERVVVFIDGSNLYHCLKEEFGPTKFDFAKLVAYVVGSRHLVRVYYYNVVPHSSQSDELIRKQQSFYNALRQLSYFELRLGRLEPRGETYVEKGVDVKLAVDMLKFAANAIYDTAILISGDADLSDAMQAVKDLGKHVELAFCTTGCSRHIQQVCDRFILLDQSVLSQCALEFPSTQSPRTLG
jgi:uncharacterized LabA/DUF88 family protein